MSRNPPKRIVIVGGGIAGERCAHELRVCGFDGSISVLGAEHHAPYDRTLLSKDVLEGGVDSGDLALSLPADYDRQGIELRLGAEVASVDPVEHEVLLADGCGISYDRLIIATGGRPTRPSPLNHPAVFVLRDIADAQRLRGALERCRRLVVVGGGFVGCEVAAAATSRGVAVTLVESEQTPLARVLGADVGARITALHEANGVEVRTGAAATGVRRSGKGDIAVSLTDGTVVTGDAVVLGTGMVPQVSWLSGSAVSIDDGIVTDSLCRTTAPHIFAAGDCARWWNPRYQALMRVEHWDTAARHGAAAARSALGFGEPFAPTPFFWSCQYGTRLQWVGHAPAWDSVEVEDLDPPGSFLARYRHGGRLVAVLGAGQARAVAAARVEIETQEEVAA